MNELSLKAPAKINLCLRVLGERPDGFTDIWSIVQTVSLFDEIDIEKAESGLSLSSNDVTLPLDSSNTAAKAWGALCQLIGSELGVKIHIGKRIPSRSGLGGGSSDAASVLIGLRDLYDIDIENDTLAKIGAIVGSDVPLFFGTGTSLITGRGERVTDIELNKDYALLIVKPRYGMSTGRAYEIAKKGLTKGYKENIITRLQPPDSALDACKIGNDLESVFLGDYPAAEKLIDRLISNGALHAALTGSGSALFGYFDDIKSAEKAGEGFEIWHNAVTPISLDKRFIGIGK